MTSSSSSAHVIGIDKFGGEDFHNWKFKMQMVLVAKDLWDIVDGTEVQPKEEPKATEWRKRDRRALADICLSLKDNQLPLVRSASSSQEAWRKLCETYETKNLANKLFLRRKFFTMQKAEEDSMLEHVNKVKTLAEKLEAIGAGVSEDDVVMTLLMSLPETYGNLITALESRADNLTLEFVTARLLHEEARRNEADQQALVKEAALFAGKGGQDQGLRKSGDKRGGGASGSSSSGSKQRVCFYCDKPGHIARDCWKKEADKKRESGEANVASGSSGSNARPSGGNGGVVREQVYVSGFSANTASERSMWLIDSGASSHMCCERDMFDTFEQITPINIYVGNDATIKAVGKGTVRMTTYVQEDGKTVAIPGRLSEVLYVPELAKNLFAVSAAAARGLTVQFDEGGCKIKRTTGDCATVAVGVKQDNLYKMVCTVMRQRESAHVAAGGSVSEDVWHKRFGHLSTSNIKMLKDGNLVTGLEMVQDAQEQRIRVCEPCLQGKQHRTPFPTGGGTRASQPLQLVHSDVVCIGTRSFGGAKYYVCFVDDYTRKIWAYPMRSKDEVFSKFQEFKHRAENECGRTIKTLRCDNGGEYVSKRFDAFLKAHGIGRQTSTPFTPQQNGVAERCNRTIVEMIRCMLHHSKRSASYWAEALQSAVHIKNRSPHRAVEVKTPEELWTGHKPDVSHLRVFGCDAYVHIPKHKRGKLESKSVKCVFVGYQDGCKGWRLYEPRSNQLFVSRDVTFVEDTSSSDYVGDGGEAHIESQVLFQSEPVQRDDQHAIEEQHVEQGCDHDAEDEDDDVPTVHDDAAHDVPDNNQVAPAAQRPRRIRYKPVEYWKVNPERVQANAVCTSAEPNSFQQAVQSVDATKWMEAMQEEIKSIQDNEVYELTALPSGRKAVSCKWVYKIKQNADGSVERYKARLVARGFTQTEGVDYNETFAPVVKYSSIRCLLSLAAHLDWEVHQMDVKTAFLNGDLEEEIYMQQPEGFVERDKEHMVWRLKKALYGLKQSPRMWNAKLHQHLEANGFKRSNADNSVYVRHVDNDNIVVIAVYVDDLLLFSNSMHHIDAAKQMLSRTFDMKDLGEAHWILGIEVTRDRVKRVVRMSQAKYLHEKLEEFGMADCKPVSTPMEENLKLTKEMEPKNEEELEQMRRTPYRAAVGSLMHAMIATRPDICFAVGVVSRFMANPGMQHWMAVKRILRYLRGTANLCLELGGNGQQATLVGYSDADWGGDAESRRSVSGYVFSLGSGAVSWSSKRQATVALSSTEAEYMASTHAVKEALWLRSLLRDIECCDVGTTLEIKVDNQSSIALSKNPTQHARTKHIDIQHHFVREQVEEGNVKLEYCPSEDMVADVMTKALGRIKHQKFVGAMGLKHNGDYGSSGSLSE